MARNDTPTPAAGRSRQRGKPVQVQAKTPWGFIVGGSVLGLLLVGVVAYAVLNQGAGFEDPLEKADSSIEGVAVADKDADAQPRRRPGRLPAEPAERRRPQRRAAELPGLRRSRSPDEHAVHSMEHGAVWITYQPDLPADQVATLRDGGRGRPVRADEPVPGPEVARSTCPPGAAASSVDSASDDPRVEEFIETYTQRPADAREGRRLRRHGHRAARHAAPAPAASVPPRPRADAPADDERGPPGRPSGVAGLRPPAGRPAGARWR